MSRMPSLHDSLIVGYSVDGVARTLVLRTTPHQGAGGHFEVRFEGLVTYHLEGDCLQNIVLEIREAPADAVVRESEAAERHRLYGWPPGWDPKRESLAAFVARQGARFFEVSCSYGMGGWVAARTMDVVARQETIHRS